MKTNVIVFLGNSYELCKAFGLFGKENLEYKSEFDHRLYKNSKYVKYYFEKLDCDIIFLSQPNLLDDLDNIFSSMFSGRKFDMNYADDIKIVLDALQRYSRVDLKDYFL